MGRSPNWRAIAPSTASNTAPSFTRAGVPPESLMSQRAPMARHTPSQMRRNATPVMCRDAAERQRNVPRKTQSSAITLDANPPWMVLVHPWASGKMRGPWRSAE